MVKKSKRRRRESIQTAGIEVNRGGLVIKNCLVFNSGDQDHKILEALGDQLAATERTLTKWGQNPDVVLACTLSLRYLRQELEHLGARMRTEASRPDLEVQSRR